MVFEIDTNISILKATKMVEGVMVVELMFLKNAKKKENKEKLQNI